MLLWVSKNRKRNAEIEREKMARIEKAENDLRGLQSRGARAFRTLDARRGRNHFREAIEQMIQGAP